MHAVKVTRVVMTALLLILVAACSRSTGEWHAKDISGLMPPLAFTLTRADGKVVTADDYRGRVVLVYFGYSNCPDYCPAMLSKLHRAIAGLPVQAQRDVATLFVSVDPKRDTPSVLQHYVGNFGLETVGLSGTQKQLRQLTTRYHTAFGYGQPDAAGNYVVTHGMAAYAFDREGRVRLMIMDKQDVQAVREDLERLLQG